MKTEKKVSDSETWFFEKPNKMAKSLAIWANKARDVMINSRHEGGDHHGSHRRRKDKRTLPGCVLDNTGVVCCLGW